MADAHAPTNAAAAPARPNHHRPRLIMSIIASLTLGALTTILIGLGCALWVDTNPRRSVPTVEIDLPDAGKWRLEKYEHTLMTRLVWYHRTDDASLWNPHRPEDVIPPWTAIPSTPVPSDLRATMFVVFEDAVGWPFRSQTSQSWWDPAASAGHQPAGLSIKVDDRPGADNLVSRLRILPFQPMWPGFAINTALYALPWIGLIGFVALVRRVRRSRAGRCIACGFDLRGGPHGRCPECGRPSQPPKHQLPNAGSG